MKIFNSRAHLLFAPILCTAILWSCTDDKDNGGNGTFLRLPDAHINVPGNGIKDMRIEITTDILPFVWDYEVEGNPTWVSIKKGDDYFDLTVDPTDTEEERSTKVTISSGKLSASMTISQGKKIGTLIHMREAGISVSCMSSDGRYLAMSDETGYYVYDWQTGDKLMMEDATVTYISNDMQMTGMYGVGYDPDNDNMVVGYPAYYDNGAWVPITSNNMQGGCIGIHEGKVYASDFFEYTWGGQTFTGEWTFIWDNGSVNMLPLYPEDHPMFVIEGMVLPMAFPFQASDDLSVLVGRYAGYCQVWKDNQVVHFPIDGLYEKYYVKDTVMYPFGEVLFDEWRILKTAGRAAVSNNGRYLTGTLYSGQGDMRLNDDGETYRLASTKSWPFRYDFQTGESLFLEQFNNVLAENSDVVLNDGTFFFQVEESEYVYTPYVYDATDDKVWIFADWVEERYGISLDQNSGYVIMASQSLNKIIWYVPAGNYGGERYMIHMD